MQKTDQLVVFINEVLDRRQAELGLTDGEFASLLGIDYTTLYRLRKGVSWPKSLKAFVRIIAPSHTEQAA